jgi:hypothetical protein
MASFAEREVGLTTKPVSAVLEEITKTDKPLVIILGEYHFYNSETFSIISTIIENAIVKFGKEHVSLYTESPKETINILSRSPDFTDYHVLRYGRDKGLVVVESNITCAIRKATGHCDKEYADDIISLFGKGSSPTHCVIAFVGFLHSVEIFNHISEGYDKRVYNAMGENTLEIMNEIRMAVLNGQVTSESYLALRRLPIIVNSGDVSLFRGLESSGGSGSPFISLREVESAARRSGGGGSGGTFEPIYLKNKTGDIIIECPLCNEKSGTQLESIVHRYNCPNKDKKPDISKKPAKGGRRKKTPKPRQKFRRTKKHLRSK